MLSNEQILKRIHKATMLIKAINGIFESNMNKETTVYHTCTYLLHDCTDWLKENACIREVRIDNMFNLVYKIKQSLLDWMSVHSSR